MASIETEIEELPAKRECQHDLVQRAEYQKYKGRPHSFVFDNGPAKDSSGSTFQAKGTLKSPLLFGENLHQDFDGVPAEEEFLLQWVQDVGFVSPGSKALEVLKNIQLAYLSAVFCPGVPLPDARLMLITASTVFILDDFLDDFATDNRDEAFTYNDVKAELDLLASYLEDPNDGKLEKRLETEENLTTAVHKLRALSQGFRKTRAMALEKGSPKDAQYFFNATATYIRVSVLQTHEGDAVQDELEYAYVVAITHGARPMIEAAWLIHGVHLSKEQREDPRIALFMYLADHHIGLVNDLLSLKKEVGTEDYRNKVLVKEKVLGNGQAAFDQTVDQANWITGRLLELRGKILEQYENDKRLEKALELSLNYLTGHIQFYIGTKRYVNNPMMYRFE